MHSLINKCVTTIKHVLVAALLVGAPQALSDEMINVDNPAVKMALTVQDRMLELMLDGDAEVFGELISVQFV